MDNTKDKKVTRQFGLSSASINNRVTVMVVIAILVIAGLFAYTSMPRESFPEVVIPQVYVGTAYPGNSSLDIEKLVTRPLEKEIGSISGIDKMTSTSVEGYSTIFIEFDFSVTPDEALRKVKDKVDKAMGDPEFPRDLPADPNIFEMNISELSPIMNINLSGDFSVEQLNEYAEYLEDRIERLSEITEVDIRGVADKEMKVNIDLYQLEANELSFMDVANAINSENVTISAGNLLDGSMRRTVRVVGEIESAEDLGNVIVKNEKQNVVYLRDIAEIVFEGEEPESFAREYQKPVVMVDVKKRAGKNLIHAADQIDEILRTARENVFPDNLEITITNDQSKFTRTQVSELENNIIFGMLLVILVLLFFLGLRNALFVGVAIPLSMLMAFLILSALGVTLNMMVLFGLVLALGMLVDNGIVVVENIYRHMDEGESTISAAKHGVGEVAWPIISSTATTLAAFAPLLVWPGIMGEFMQYLPITLIIVLGSSLFVALVINPVLTSMFMRLEEKSLSTKTAFLIMGALILTGLLIVSGIKPLGSLITGIGGFLMAAGLILGLIAFFFRKRWLPVKSRYLILIGFIALLEGMLITSQVIWLGNVIMLVGLLVILTKYLLNPATLYFQNRVLPWMERRYEGTLSYALRRRNPLGFFFGTILMLFLSFVLLFTFMPQVLYFPINMPNYVNVFIEAPIGTDIEEVNTITEDLEQRIIDYAKKFEVTEEKDGIKRTHNFLIESIIAQVGEGTSDPAEGPSMAQTPHKARITVSFVQFQHRRGVMTNEVMDEIRNVVAGTPGVQITVDKEPAGPPQPKPVNIELMADDYQALIVEAEKVRQFINDQNIGGVEELKLDVEVGKPEIPIEIDRAKARRFNLSTSQIGQALRNSIFGLEVSSFKTGEDDYPIMIRLQDKYRYNVDALLNQRITFRDQTTGQISQVPISAVAKAGNSTTFSAVKRKNENRLITIASNVTDDYNPNEVVDNIKAALEDYDLPEGMSLRFTGQQEDQAKEFAFLSTALMIAVFLIFMILVAQFNSALTPFIIVGSVIFSLIGVFLGLVFFQMDFIVIMTMIGIISLAGIVVNNAIVLIDYTKLTIERKRQELGLPEHSKLPIPDLIDAMVEAGKKRLRPVLLTAITTVLGLVPLAVGMNIDFFSLFNRYDPQFYLGGDNVVFWGPMSWTVIFGLTFATFLTLVIVPVMYYLKTRLAYKLAGDKELHI